MQPSPSPDGQARALHHLDVDSLTASAILSSAQTLPAPGVPAPRGPTCIPPSAHEGRDLWAPLRPMTPHRCEGGGLGAHTAMPLPHLYPGLFPRDTEQPRSLHPPFMQAAAGGGEVGTVTSSQKPEFSWQRLPCDGHRKPRMGALESREQRLHQKTEGDAEGQGGHQISAWHRQRSQMSQKC